MLTGVHNGVGVGLAADLQSEPCDQCAFERRRGLGKEGLKGDRILGRRNIHGHPNRAATEVNALNNFPTTRTCTPPLVTPAVEHTRIVPRWSSQRFSGPCIVRPQDFVCRPSQRSRSAGTRCKRSRTVPAICTGAARPQPGGNAGGQFASTTRHSESTESRSIRVSHRL